MLGRRCPQAGLLLYRTVNMGADRLIHNSVLSPETPFRSSSKYNLTCLWWGEPHKNKKGKLEWPGWCQTADSGSSSPRRDLYWVNTTRCANMFSLICTLVGWRALLRSAPWPLALSLCRGPLSSSFASPASVVCLVASQRLGISN